MEKKKKSDKKKKSSSSLETLILNILQKSLDAALKKALDDVLKDFK